MDKRTFEAAEKILKADMANLIIIGTPDEIAKNSKGFDITGATLVDPFNDPNKQKYIDKFVELRGVDTMVAAAKKKADAKVVEDTFKELNVARKGYKEDLTQLTIEYAEALDNLKKAFELGKKDITNKLAKAEEAYAKALKNFTEAHPEGYHVTLRDGDFETTISGGIKTIASKDTAKSSDIFDVFDLMFNF
jgi:hypothetical protein